MPNLTILTGNEIGKTFSWTAESIRVGRHNANDFVVNNDSVSGEHCIIERSENGWRIKDLDSTNGTRVNDNRVTLAPLHRNDVISMGDIDFSLRGDDVPEPDVESVEGADSIPRTTIVMRPTSVVRASASEGFSRKSESKKLLNIILIATGVIVVVLLAILLMKIL